MNRIKTLMATVAAAFIFAACVKDEPVVIEYLDVNANNISGSWELVEWNGAPLQQGTYVFLDIVRKDNTYTIYQNVDSFSDMPHTVTGKFFLETDPALGAVIRGNYDHDSGDWAHRYIVLELTKDSMKWVAKDNPEYIQVYKRIESVPVSE